MAARPLIRVRKLCLALPEAHEVQGEQSVMVAFKPDRFFVPPYVGRAGWGGVWVDDDPDWLEVAGLIEEAWRLIAPERLIKQLGGE